MNIFKKLDSENSNYRLLFILLILLLSACGSLKLGSDNPPRVSEKMSNAIAVCSAGYSEKQAAMLKTDLEKTGINAGGEISSSEKGAIAEGIQSDSTMYKIYTDCIDKRMSEAKQETTSKPTWVTRSGQNWQLIKMQAFGPQDGPFIVTNGIDLTQQNNAMTLTIKQQFQSAIWPVFINHESKEICVPYEYPSLPVIVNFTDGKKILYSLTGYCKV